MRVWVLLLGKSPCPAHIASTSADTDTMTEPASAHDVSRRMFVGAAVATGVWATPAVTTLGRVAAASPSCATTSNIALNKPATISSGPWPGIPTAGGNNGDTNGAMSATRNGFHTLQGVNEWWEVDLGGLFHICEVRMWNRSDCCQSRIQNVRIEVDGVQVGVGPGVIGRPTTVAIPAGTTGQVVRLTNGFNGSIWFHLSEVEIFGCAA